jgi:hypothetical protein
MYEIEENAVAKIGDREEGKMEKLMKRKKEYK